MPRKMEVVFLKAEPWRDGREVAGFFEGVESIPNADSRKITMNATGKAGSDFVVWETAALKNLIAQFEPGKFYAIKCIGKKAFKGGTGWNFDVLAFDDGEVDAAIRKHANKETLFT